MIVKFGHGFFYINRQQLDAAATLPFHQHVTLFNPRRVMGCDKHPPVVEDRGNALHLDFPRRHRSPRMADQHQHEQTREPDELAAIHFHGDVVKKPARFCSAPAILLTRPDYGAIGPPTAERLTFMSPRRTATLVVPAKIWASMLPVALGTKL